jgi:hypothetical protein
VFGYAFTIAARAWMIYGAAVQETRETGVELGME